MVLFLCDQFIPFTFLAIPTWTLGLISPAIILKSMNMTWYKNLTHYPSKNSSQRKGSMSWTQLCLLSSEVLLKRLFALIPQATNSMFPAKPHFQLPITFPQHFEPTHSIWNPCLLISTSHFNMSQSTISLNSWPKFCHYFHHPPPTQLRKSTSVPTSSPDVKANMKCLSRFVKEISWFASLSILSILHHRGSFQKKTR